MLTKDEFEGLILVIKNIGLNSTYDLTLIIYLNLIRKKYVLI